MLNKKESSSTYPKCSLNKRNLRLEITSTWYRAAVPIEHS